MKSRRRRVAVVSGRSGWIRVGSESVGVGLVTVGVGVGVAGVGLALPVWGGRWVEFGVGVGVGVLPPSPLHASSSTILL